MLPYLRLLGKMIATSISSSLFRGALAMIFWRVAHPAFAHVGPDSEPDFLQIYPSAAWSRPLVGDAVGRYLGRRARRAPAIYSRAAKHVSAHYGDRQCCRNSRHAAAKHFIKSNPGEVEPSESNQLTSARSSLASISDPLHSRSRPMRAHPASTARAHSRSSRSNSLGQVFETLETDVSRLL
jgi:hypothetical protein